MVGSEDRGHHLSTLMPNPPPCSLRRNNREASMGKKPAGLEVIEPHIQRAWPPLPSRLTAANDGEENMPLEPGEWTGPVTILPMHRRAKGEMQ